jgi:hypothetical protein
VLLDICDDIWYDLFTEWLPIEAVGVLDSALCQKSRRPYFLHQISKKVLLFGREEINVLEKVIRNFFDVATLTYKGSFGANALSWVLKRGIHLASLRLTYQYGFSPIEQGIMREAVASLLINGFLDKLETIKFSNWWKDSDADLAAIISKCYGSLKSIDIRHFGFANNLSACIKRCTKLEEFVPCDLKEVSQLAEIFESCKNLRKIDLGCFDEHEAIDEAVLAVAAHCSQLEHINLGNCEHVSNAAIRKVAESCPLLQFVDFVWTDITDATVALLCNHCPFLRQVHVGGCDQLTDTAVLAIAERLPGITHIDLCGLAMVTSSAVETLVSKCLELEYISLACSPNVSDVTLAKIAEHSSKLEELHVSACDNITGDGLATVFSKCRELKCIDLSYNSNVNDVTLAKIAEHSSKLEELHVSACRNITGDGLARFASECPKLKTVEFGSSKMTSAGSLTVLFPNVNWNSRY